MPMPMPAMRTISFARSSIYDPGMLQDVDPRQPPPYGPVAAFDLQKPSTASSGRSGKRLASGFSYGFLALLFCCCIALPLPIDGARNGTTAATSRSASAHRRMRRLIRDGRNPFRFTRLQRLGRLADHFVSLAARAVFAIA